MSIWQDSVTSEWDKSWKEILCQHGNETLCLLNTLVRGPGLCRWVEDWLIWQHSLHVKYKPNRANSMHKCFTNYTNMHVNRRGPALTSPLRSSRTKSYLDNDFKPYNCLKFCIWTWCWWTYNTYKHESDLFIRYSHCNALGLKSALIVGL